MQNGQNLEIEFDPVKTQDEISLLRQAAQWTQQILQDVVPLIRPGATELDIAEEIAGRMRFYGLEPSFDTIVASGENGAEPHHVPNGRKFSAGGHDHHRPWMQISGDIAGI